MHYIQLHKDDKYFVENLSVAQHWAEEGSIAILTTDDIEINLVLRMSVLQYAGSHPVLRYRLLGGTVFTLDMRRIERVSWRPDIQRLSRTREFKESNG